MPVQTKTLSTAKIAMPSSLRNPETFGKKVPKEGKGKAPSSRSKKVVPISEPVESDDEDEDENDEGIDEEGMARLMKALGEDGLDEFGQAQLRSLAGDDDSSDVGDASSEGEGEDDEDAGANDEDDDDEEESAAEDDEDAPEDNDQEQEEDEDEETAVLLDEAEDVDEDAVPRQKIEVDNKVGSH